MINRLMKKYALSKSGAKDYIKAILICILADLSAMLPVAILYFLVRDLLNGKISTSHYLMFIGAVIISLVVIFIVNYFKYNLTFFNTYIESGNRRIRLAEKLRKLPLSFFGKKDISDLTTVILGDATVLEHNFSHIMPQFTASLISTFIIAISLFIFNTKLAIASLWVYPVALIIVATSSKVQRLFSEKKMNMELSVASSVQEGIDNLKEIKANNFENEYLESLNKKVKILEKRQIGAELGTSIFVISSSLILKLGIATTALVGSNLLVKGEIDILTFFMFLLVVSRIYEPMQASLVNLAAINAQKLNVDRMNELQNCNIQTGKTDLKIKNYDIEFNNVDFSYDTSEQILDKVSFVAEQGKITALIGPSGSGKSTISKLAARFWDVSDGLITIGGEDITKIDPETLLKNFSIVFQDVTLFDNSIMENIRIGKLSATDEEVLNAAKLANCDEFVNKLKDGYNTIIGENGSKLSGGERQRISIARAILKDAPVILLDEATASLDAENETQIQEALSKLVKDKTVLMIAHRMRTIENADKIIVLEDGHVKETGTPKELMKQNGLFKHMVEIQQESQKWNLI